MYLEHFQLKEFPFLSSPDSRFLYLSDQVNETLQKCLYLISNRIGPLFCAGPIGTGKTTLAKRLHQQLENDTGKYIIAYLVIPPKITVNALLRMIMDEFEVKTERSYDGCLKNLATWLVQKHTEGIKPVVIMDEAQNLTPTNLKLLHFLLNYETDREKLVQLVLFGQSELANRIERFPELKSRMYPAGLAAFNRKDMEDMITFRWMVAGGKVLPFSTHVLDELFRLTLGLPREIVKLCDLALLRTFSSGRQAVHNDDVQEAAKELHLQKE
jgi:general secretion pathway protein A